MKRLICLLCAFLTFCGCSPIEQEYTAKKNDYITGVWLSFAELDTMLAADFKQEFDTVIKNCKAKSITDMFVHVRPYCDAIYPSKLFPIRESAQSADFDLLKYMIDVCHQNGINFHAWLNPFRVRTADSEVTKLPADSPAFKWLNDQNAQNDSNIIIKDGIYLNPASNEVRMLIIDGIREIVDNYLVDGIHFDDYFYPTTDESFDVGSYSEYLSDTKTPLSLADWRRSNVNLLISSAFTAIKFKDKNITFSVSPSASINDNFNKQYADIKTWVHSGCVDYIIPQLYFGFEYPQEKFAFENLIKGWQELIKGTDVRLLIGLATYKINTETEPDSTEWANGVDVINRQIKICKQNENISGHIFFSYSSMEENI